MTAKIVIASAKRLMPVRHLCRNRKRIAEISVPAWPMPTQKTKLMMGKPHITGFWLPHTPTPVANRYMIMAPKMPRNPSEITNATYHARGARRASLTEQIFSVTVPKS